MTFIPPIALIRKNLILRKLKKSNAFSPETALSLADAGVMNPDAFKRITEVMLERKLIKITADGRYYL